MSLSEARRIAALTYRCVQSPPARRDSELSPARFGGDKFKRSTRTAYLPTTPRDPTDSYLGVVIEGIAVRRRFALVAPTDDGLASSVRSPSLFTVYSEWSSKKRLAAGLYPLYVRVCQSCSLKANQAALSVRHTPYDNRSTERHSLFI
ncbi:hypothetical protein LSAT2_006152 [Lamellibrachia satsuma]|nr:hypothetical protein LSAT2_006152 [Lamellibrachia satsuma]